MLRITRFHYRDIFAKFDYPPDDKIHREGDRRLPRAPEDVIPIPTTMPNLR